MTMNLDTIRSEITKLCDEDQQLWAAFLTAEDEELKRQAASPMLTARDAWHNTHENRRSLERALKVLKSKDTSESKS